LWHFDKIKPEKVCFINVKMCHKPMKATKALVLLMTAILFFLSCSKQDSTSSPDPSSPGSGSDVATINGFSPAAGVGGDIITISGSNFGTSAAFTRVSFNGKSAQVISVSPTEITVIVPENCGTGKISLTIRSVAATTVNNFQYLTLTGQWVQMAAFPGTTRIGAVGFTIAGKGYIVGGSSLNTSTGISTFENDLWEYDPSTNQWTKKADFPGIARAYAVGFAIGNKGYLGTGISETAQSLNDFWEYDPATNAWTRKTDFPGTAREDAAGFAIGNNGFLGSGEDQSASPFKDFWKYDAAVDTWTQVADFPGNAQYAQTAFSINNVGYVGLGGDDFVYTNEFWQYNPSTNTWTQKADFPGKGRIFAAYFIIDNKAFIGPGLTQGYKVTDHWQYDPSNDQWTRRAEIPENTREGGIGFSINNKGYIAIPYPNLTDTWEFLP
jgi:N-acetylneuraminic acid mutarotase